MLRKTLILFLLVHVLSLCFISEAHCAEMQELKTAKEVQKAQHAIISFKVIAMTIMQTTSKIIEDLQKDYEKTDKCALSPYVKTTTLKEGGIAVEAMPYSSEIVYYFL